MESTAADPKADAVSADTSPAVTAPADAASDDAASDHVASEDAAFEAVVAAVAALAELRRHHREDLAGSDPLRRGVDNSLDRLSAITRLEASTAALKVHTAADFAERTRALTPPTASPQEHTAHELAAIAELACVLTISERAGSALLGEAHRLTTALPLTMTALQAGTLSWQHARAMVDETLNLGHAAAGALEAHFLDPGAPNPARGVPAGELTPSRFRHKARTWRERHHPDSIEKRHTRSAADRRIEYTPDRDGMAWLSAYLPAHQVAGIWDRTTAAARALQSPDEPRTLTQLRADTAAAWLLGGNAEKIPSPRAHVLVTVPVFALMGLTEEPTILDGYGPIPPSMARQLVADGAKTFHRVLTDPRNGAPLEISRDSYRIPKALRQWLRLRDGKCPFPGCSNPSLDNDADHLLAWAKGGTTGISNLGQPCRRHHRLRHTTAWEPTAATKDSPPGWTSPTGRHYQSEHPDWEPPTWPEGLPAEDLPEDPFPEHNLLPIPRREDDLPDYVLFPDDSLPGRPLPQDPYPTWAAEGWTADDRTAHGWTAYAARG
jgi:hypothetical protein